MEHFFSYSELASGIGVMQMVCKSWTPGIGVMHANGMQILNLIPQIGALHVIKILTTAAFPPCCVDIFMYCLSS